jgi:hypothetical protein
MAIHEHTYPEGTLRLETHEDSHELSARFVATTDKSIYEAEFGRLKLVMMHKVFISMPEYLTGFIRHRPKIGWYDAEDIITVSFDIREGEHRYIFNFKLPAKSVGQPSEEKRVDALRAQVAGLTEQIASRDALLSKLSMMGIYLLIGADQKKVDDTFGMFAPSVKAEMIRQSALFHDVGHDFNNDLYERLVRSGLLNVNDSDASSFFSILEDAIYSDEDDAFEERMFDRVMFMIDNGLDLTIRNMNGDVLAELEFAHESLSRQFSAPMCACKRDKIARALPIVARLKTHVALKVGLSMAE